MNISGVKLLAVDVDGTLTDGKLLYGPAGVTQAFNAKDGAGIMRLLDKGVEVAFVSFRDFTGTRRRASDLGVKLLCLGSLDKAASVSRLAGHLGIPLSSVLFMGDDRKDIPAMKAAGVSACPRDAAAEVKALCDIVTEAQGGAGAVREIIDMILEDSGE
ncbi:MAG: HAD hydrolase family protein [Candidatus Fermentibacteria bacterium]|nr:HAD hydrolase family protein [Candidatus Fermentibacteria bacterium]